MVPQQAKNYDLTFNWMKCREAQMQFDFIWKQGNQNRADYHPWVALHLLQILQDLGEPREGNDQLPVALRGQVSDQVCVFRVLLGEGFSNNLVDGLFRNLVAEVLRLRAAGQLKNVKRLPPVLKDIRGSGVRLLKICQASLFIHRQLLEPRRALPHLEHVVMQLRRVGDGDVARQVTCSRSRRLRNGVMCSLSAQPRL